MSNTILKYDNFWPFRLFIDSRVTTNSVTLLYTISYYVDTWLQLAERPKYKLKSIWHLYLSSVKYLHLTCHCWVGCGRVMAQSEYTATGLTVRRGRMISTIAPDLPATVNTDSGHSTKWVQTFIYYYQTIRERWDEQVILMKKKNSHSR